MTWSRVIVAAVLMAVGVLSWRGGQVEQRLADAQEQLAFLRYTAPEEAAAELESALGMVGRVPWVADAVNTATAAQVATANYWQAEYAELAPRRDETGTSIKQAPELMLVAANAAFRTSQSIPDRQAQFRLLDEAVRQYGDVLKERPEWADAAFNFEYVTRVRDTLAKSRASTTRAAGPSPSVPTPVMAGDLPDGPTLHGRPGAPPPATDMSQFKMHVPVRPEERQGGQDHGPGAPKARRG